MKKHFLLVLFFATLLSYVTPLKGQGVWADVYYGTSKGTVYDLYTDSYDDLLYVAGNYDTLGPIFYPSRGFGTWDGNAWDDWTDGNDGFGNDITKAVGRYNGEIYHSVDIGAVFVGIQTKETRIAKFLCTSSNCHGNTMHAFEDYQGELYGGGTWVYFDTTELIAPGVTIQTPHKPYYGIAKYDGSHWTPVGGGFRSINPSNGTGVRCLLVYKGKLYAGGKFDSAGDVAAKNIAVWDGVEWKSVGTGVESTISGIAGTIYDLTVFQNNIIAGGVFNVAGGVEVKNIARWNGTNWVSLNADFNDAVKAVCKYNKKLYAAGDFSFGGIDSNHIAKFDGSTWSTVGGGMTGGVVIRDMTVWNKMLIIGGAFTELEDSIKVFNVASWKDMSFESPLKESDFELSPDIISGPTVIHLKGTEPITKVEVTDPAGRLCLVQELYDENFNISLELEAKNWAPGVYLVGIHTESGTVNKKLVVMQK